MLAISTDMAALCASIGAALSRRSGATDTFTGSDRSLPQATRAPMDIPDGLTPLVLDGVTYGWLGREWRDRVLQPPSPFVARGDAVTLDPALVGFEQRSGAIADWAARARRHWRLPGWREERCVVRAGEHAACMIERALLRPFGMVLHSVQATAYRRGHTGPQLWVAHRSHTKPVEPGRLDALVGGGIAGFDEPWTTLLRECAEEAAIPEALARQARPAGCLELCYATVYDDRPALHRERVTLFDLELPPDFTPHCTDGEHQAILSLTPAEVLASIHTGRWTREGAQAALDLIARQGWFTPATATG
jgi:8-oxo-dGTP pyrophosphatase MutT (NUDIX family)